MLAARGALHEDRLSARDFKLYHIGYTLHMFRCCYCQPLPVRARRTGKLSSVPLVTLIALNVCNNIMNVKYI